MPRRERVAVTGLGLVSAAGKGIPALRAALLDGKTFLGPLRPEVANGLSMGRGGTAPLEGPDRALNACLLAAQEALESSGLGNAHPSSRIGVAIGTALGSIERGEAFVRGAVPGELRSLPLHVLASELAQRFGLTGPRGTFSVTCLSSLHAIERALSDLSLGRADAVLAGGVDVLTRFMQAGFCSLDVLSGSGLVLGEAACFAVLEPLERARERGANVLGVIRGLGMRSDATHLTSPDESGRGMERAIFSALEESGLAMSRVGTVSLTAPASGVYERMYENLFSRMGRKPPTTTWEASIGHVLAASGAVGLAHACLELGKPGERGPVLALNVGFGGQNGALVVERARTTGLGRDREPRRGSGLALVSRGVATGAESDLEERFPGRWNAKKAFFPEVRSAIQAVANATAEAGWWRKGSGEPVRGGLVVATDVHAFESAGRFARSLEKGGLPAARPSDFLFSLPSSAAAMLGVLFGLEERQATVAGGGLAAFEAIGHGLDLLELGVLERVVVAALSFVGPEVARGFGALGMSPPQEGFELAVAWCLERGGKGGIEVESTSVIEGGSPDPARGGRATKELLADVPEAWRTLAAPSLLACDRLVQDMKKGDNVRVVHHDPCRGVGLLSLRSKE